MGITLTLIVLLLLSLASGFFLLGELEDKCREEDKREDEDDGSKK